MTVRPLALIPILFLLADPTDAAGLSGRFKGAYECSGAPFAVVVNLTEDGPGRISGDVFIEAQPVPFGQRRMSKPVKASGTFDERTGAFSFRTDDRLYIGHDLGSRKSEPVTLVLQGTRSADTGFIGGTVAQQGCALFALAPEGTNQVLFSQFVDLVRYEQEVRRGFVPIELRPFGGQPDRRQAYYVYADGATSATVDRRDLLDAVAQELSRAEVREQFQGHVVGRRRRGALTAFQQTHACPRLLAALRWASLQLERLSSGPLRPTVRAARAFDSLRDVWRS